MILICDVVEPGSREPYSRDPRYVARKAERYLDRERHRDDVVLGPRGRVLHLRLAAVRDRRPQVDVRDRLRRGHLELVAATGRRTSPTGRGRRRATSRSRRWTRSRTCAARWSSRCRRPASTSRSSTTRSAGPARPRSTSATGRSSRPPTRSSATSTSSSRSPHAAGKVATFMPKPLFGDNGSGMHTHQSLWKDGTNLFYDEKGYALLSDTARCYIGGLLKHAKAVLGVRRADDQLVPPARPGLRGADQPRLLAAQPLGLHPHPDVLHDARRAAPRVPLARPDLQPVPVVQRPAARRPRRRHQQDRAARPGRPRHLRDERRGEGRHRRHARARSRRRSTRSRPTRSSCIAATSSPRTSSTPGSTSSGPARRRSQLRPHPYEFYLYSEM